MPKSFKFLLSLCLFCDLNIKLTLAIKVSLKTKFIFEYDNDNWPNNRVLFLKTVNFSIESSLLI